MMEILVVDGTKYYYDDGGNAKASMTDEFNWWSFVSHLVAVVFSYYMFVVKMTRGCGFGPQRRVGGRAAQTRRGSQHEASPGPEAQGKKLRLVAVHGPITYKSRSKLHYVADGRYTPLGVQKWGVCY